MGGHLAVHSQPGEGSEFFFSLPLEFAARKLAPSEERQSLRSDFAVQHPLSLLVAEDDTINLRLTVTILRNLGYQPVCAANGREALEIYRTARPDCVLMDLQMPEMDGLEATRAIRAAETELGGKPSFISALTANVLAEERRRCEQAGMDDYLTKPLKREALAQVLIRAWESRSV
jgi:CheY-like chemotaxis protein